MLEMDCCLVSKMVILYGDIPLRETDFRPSRNLDAFLLPYMPHESGLQPAVDLNTF